MTETRWTRRGALGAAGAAGVAGVAYLVGGVRVGGDRSAATLGVTEEAAAATCVMTPAKTEGPYFVDEKLNRSDVRESQPGAKLVLTMYVFDADDDCAPVKGAVVDIWHANASGRYSDEANNGTAGQTWLRGSQVTDADGKVTFTTIHPGWYSGRAVHIHFKVRVPDGTTRALEFTSQLFFTDAQNRKVFAQAPYSARGNADVADGSDNIYGSDGSSLLLHPAALGAGGWAADFSVGVSRSTSQTTAGTPDGTVGASLAAVTAAATASGARRLTLRIKSTEPIAATARLTRQGRTLASRARSYGGAGTHVLRVPVPASVRAGAATLRITFTDAAGNRRTIRRSVHVPRRR